MWIMIAGPYTSGGADPEQRALNLKRLNGVAWEVLQKGHVPLIGVNLALPIIESCPGADFDRVMMPISLALAQRCDAVLRVGGPSRGADQEVEAIRARGGAVFQRVEDIPLEPGSSIF